MKNSIQTLLVAACVLSMAASATASFVKRVTAFQAQSFEGFENVTDSGLANRMDGLASFAGSGLTVQNGDLFNLWDQHAFEGHYFLGAFGGYGAPSTIEVTFAVPVNAFGGLFGHRVHPGIESAGNTEFVFYDAHNREIGRDSLLIGSLPGSEPGYWQFGRGVKRITITSMAPMADALTAKATTVNMRRLQRIASVRTAPAN